MIRGHPLMISENRGGGGSGNSDFSKKGLENKIRTKGRARGGSKSPKKFGRHQWMSHTVK